MSDLVGNVSGTGGSLPVGEPNHTNVRVIQFPKGRRISSRKLVQLGAGCDCFRVPDSTFKLKKTKESQPSDVLLNRVQNLKTGVEFFGMGCMVNSQHDLEACPKATQKIKSRPSPG